MRLPIIAGAVLIVFLATWRCYRYRPDDMSEVGIRHFQMGVMLSGISIIVHIGAYALLYVFGMYFTPYQFLEDILMMVILVTGNACNLTAIFYFFRELLPGGEITPEGMTLGLVMSIEQLHWILFGIMFGLRNGF